MEKSVDLSSRRPCDDGRRAPTQPPLGVLPQRDRRPRSIIVYTFYRVNEDTVVMALPEAMQFGKALWRIFSAIVHSNPRLGPVYLSKVYIADGFYRIWVKAANVPKLGVHYTVYVIRLNSLIMRIEI
jgi:hypothetical protein